MGCIENYLNWQYCPKKSWKWHDLIWHDMIQKIRILMTHKRRSWNKHQLEHSLRISQIRTATPPLRAGTSSCQLYWWNNADTKYWKLNGREKTNLCRFCRSSSTADWNIACVLLDVIVIRWRWSQKLMTVTMMMLFRYHQTSSTQHVIDIDSSSCPSASRH